MQRTIMLVTLLLPLLLSLITGGVEGGVNPDLLAVVNEAQEQSKLLQVGSGNNAVDDMGITLLDDELAVLKKLNGLNVTANILFSVRTRKDIDKRAQLPHFGPWLGEVVKLEFQDRNPKIAYQLLGEVSSLLRISSIGCSGFSCEIPLIQILSQYQNLMFKALQTSWNSVKDTVELMAYFREAVRNPKNAEEKLKICIPLANKFASAYQELKRDVRELRFKVNELATKDVEDSNIEIRKKWDKLLEDEKQLDLMRKKQEVMDQEMMKRAKEQLARIEEVEAKQLKLATAFVKLLQTPVRKGEKCKSTVLEQYKAVTNYVTKAVTYSKGKSWYLIVTVDHGEGVYTYKNKITTSQRLSDKIHRRCWTEKDASHLAELDTKMKAVQTEMTSLQPEYLMFLKDLYATQKNRSSLVGSMAETAAMLEQMKLQKVDYSNGQNALMLVATSLKTVKTVFLEAQFFWKDQANFITKYLSMDRKSEDTEIDEILGVGKKQKFRERMLKTGMYWLVFGRLSSIAFTQMRKGYTQATRAYVNNANEEERKQILENAGNTIEDMRKLLKRLNENDKLTNTKMDKALEETIKRFGSED